MSNLIETSLSTGEQKEVQIFSPQNATAEQVDRIFEMIKSGKYEKSISIMPELLNFDEVGVSITGVYLGFKTLDILDNTTGIIKSSPAVHFLALDKNGNKKLYANLGKMFVDAFKTMPSLTPFECTLTEIKKLGGGRTFKVYDIKIITVAK
jgi:hypothetical protein